MTLTATKTDASTSKADTKKASLKGVRAILWFPNLDPTTPQAPSVSTPVRSFLQCYMDSAKMAISPASGRDSIIPQFKTFTLPVPGLNWIPCSEWDDVVAASANFGREPETITAEMSTSDRLRLATRQGLDPIAIQLRARSIVVPELITDQPTGTINDYSLDSIQLIAETAPTADIVEQWLRSIQTSLIPHPQKLAVERYLDRRIAQINGVR